MRRAEVIFRGKHVSGLEFMAGYDPKADKWLDLSVKGRINAISTWRVGQFKQPNSLEELGSTRNNDFIAKALARSLDSYRIEFDNADVIEGSFQLTSFEVAGDYNGEQTYNLSLESSGALTVTAA